MKDPIPNVRTAGVTTTIKDESAARCIHSELYAQNAPPTPEHIKKYRKSF
jgi:hypothetical protein